MQTILASVTAAVAAVAPASSPIPVQRMGLYVVSDDLPRSRTFYRALFGAPQIELLDMIGFDVAGGLYAVVARGRYAPDARRGDTMRAYLKVADLTAAFDRARTMLPGSLEQRAITVEGAFRFFRLRDPDGNLIEFFSIG